MVEFGVSQIVCIITKTNIFEIQNASCETDCLDIKIVCFCYYTNDLGHPALDVFPSARKVTFQVEIPMFLESH